MVQHGVGQDGNASGPKDDLHGAYGGNLFPGDIAGTVVPDVAVEGFLKTFGIAVAFKIPGVVGPGDDAVRKRTGKLLVGHGKAPLREPSAHFPVTGYAAVHKVFHPAAQKGAAAVQIEPYNVNVLPFVIGRKFNAGNDFYVFAPGGRQGFPHAVYGVVVGKGDGAKAFFNGIIHQGGGGKASV